MRNSIKFLFGLALVLTSCKGDKEKDIIAEAPKLITHYNIKIVSDLSNRLDKSLYKRQLDDKEVIKEVLSVFPSLLKNYGRIALQKDKISYGLLNPLEIDNYNELKDSLTIDLGIFGTDQNKRIEFVRNRKQPNLNGSIKNFNKAIGTIYKTALERSGFYTADTWGFFKQSVDKHYFTLTNPTNSIKAQDVSRNVIILITDGFLEDASLNSKTSCPDKVCKFLDVQRLEKFRKYYEGLENEISLEKAFEQSGFGITPVNNDNLRNVEVLMLELNGRDHTGSGKLTEKITDFEILKLFWEDFLLREGVSKVEINNVKPSADEIRNLIQKFLTPQ